MLFACCCITFIKYPSLALMGCKRTLGEKYIKIKLQTAWENAFQVPHKDFIPISKASPREQLTGFTLDLADAGTGLLLFTIPVFTPTMGLSGRKHKICSESKANGII